jgi:WXG100 family type VII secretion target
VGGYAVDPAQLRGADTQLAAVAVDARTALAQLQAAAAEALNAWHGSAGSAFRSAWEQWLDGVRVLLDAVDEMAALVGDAGEGYAATEEAVRRIASRAGS